ncbi:hypothetical protein D3C80_1243470 [compost metagenome]
MLHVGEVEAPVLASQIMAVHRQCGDRGEWQVVVARQGNGNGRVVAGVDDHLMKAHVQVVIDLQVVFAHKALVEQLIAVDQALLQRSACLHRQATFCSLTRRQPLQHTAHLDRTRDVIGADRTHLKPPATKAHQQAFLFEGAKCHAHRHA